MEGSVNELQVPSQRKMTSNNKFASNYCLKIIYAISFMDLFAVGLIYPALRPHIRSLGASHLTIGFIGTLYSGLQILSGPLLGSWSDVRGTKFVLILSLLVSSICYLILGITSSLTFVICIRAILGCTKHTQTLCKAFIANSLSREEQAQAYGYSSALGSVGFIIGPIISGHISELPNGFFYVSCLTATLFIVNIVLTLALPENKKEDIHGDAVQKNLLLSAAEELKLTITNLREINWKIYWDAFTVRLLYGLCTSMYFFNQSMYLQEKYDLSQIQIGYVISFFSAVGALFGLCLGYITKKLYSNDVNCSNRLLHFWLLLTVSLVLLNFAQNITTYIVLLIPFGISSIVIRIVSMELLLTRVETSGKGSVSGASNSVMSVARFISPTISGVVGNIFGEGAIMLALFVPSLTATAICFSLKYTKKTKIS